MFSCGSFDSSSLAHPMESTLEMKNNLETMKPKSDYFKNYFSDEAE